MAEMLRVGTGLMRITRLIFRFLSISIRATPNTSAGVSQQQRICVGVFVSVSALESERAQHQRTFHISLDLWQGVKPLATPSESIQPPRSLQIASQLALPLDVMRSNVIYPTNERCFQDKQENQ